MKEIGGYIELEHYHGMMLHSDGIKLDCGRNCLAYLITAKKIKKIAIPYFMCETAFVICEQYGVEVQQYHVGYDFRMLEELSLDENTWLYVINYYGQLTDEEIICLKKKYDRIIVDNAQAYFRSPVVGIDTLYTCRKFFGVPDGGILFTDVQVADEIPQSESHTNMMHLIGRFEKNGTAFYRESVENNDRFLRSPLLRMSKLTENLLRSIDYDFVKNTRTENFAHLHSRLAHINELNLRPVEGAFAYPLFIQDGWAMKKYLIQNKIYVPTLWPNVLDTNAVGSVEYRLARDILPLPCDQRYGVEEMEFICNLIDGVV